MKTDEPMSRAAAEQRYETFARLARRRTRFHRAARTVGRTLSVVAVVAALVWAGFGLSGLRGGDTVEQPTEPAANSHALVIEITRPESPDGSYVAPVFQAFYGETEIPLEAIETPGPDLKYPRAASPVPLPVGTPILIRAEAAAVAVFELGHARGQYVVEQGACLVPGALTSLPDGMGSSAFFIWAEWSDVVGGMAFRADLVAGTPASDATQPADSDMNANLLGLAVCEE